MNNYIASQSVPDEHISFARSHLWPPETGFQTKDGRVDFIIRVEENWAEFCQRIGASHVLDDARFTNWWSARTTWRSCGKLSLPQCDRKPRSKR
jgi:crotonobetainyl-CoA:carnitine CoA-transferase CaiB-like acyl-CoA transferase